MTLVIFNDGIVFAIAYNGVGAGIEPWVVKAKVFAAFVGY